MQAKVTLPNFFSNNMVLQRDMPIRIWGMADKNEVVTISFNGITEQVKAGKNGKWNTQLPAMQFGGPFSMTIKGKDNTIVFDNILIGDVWLCSGQSNMEFPLADDYTAREEIPASGNKNIRLLTIPKTIQTQEQDDVPQTSWVECNPSTTPNFSAVAYFFGQNLQKELNIPIGLINSSWGGTIIETWMSWSTSTSVNDEFKKYKGETIEQAFGHTGKELNNIWGAINNQDEGIINKWYLPDADNIGWKIMYEPKAWDGELKDERGVVWFRREITLPADVADKAGKLHLGKIIDIDRSYFNGVFVGSRSPLDIRDYDVTVKGGKNLIVVRIQVMDGPGGMQSKTEDFYLEVDGKKYPLAGDWEYKPALLISQTGLKSPYIPNTFASLLYNGMIHPLTKYEIKGVIWYQGESNAGEAFKYRTLLPALIANWRKQWGYDFPFDWVQLPGFQSEDAEPKESAWAELREAQNLTLKVPKTGQAVITDIGNAIDIHPRNKKDVGYRLAQSVLKKTYGKDILGEGPVYEKMEIDTNKIILYFSNTGKGLATQKNKYGYLNGFAIAGNNRKFYYAKANISGNKVIVSSDKVENPVAVRYAWANNPCDANLVNSDGLLASPFRTDSWKEITQK